MSAAKYVIKSSGLAQDGGGEGGRTHGGGVMKPWQGEFPAESATDMDAAAIEILLRNMKAGRGEPVFDDEPEEESCAHDWQYSGTAYGGDDESYHGEGRCYCSKCGADGDA